MGPFGTMSLYTYLPQTRSFTASLQRLRKGLFTSSWQTVTDERGRPMAAAWENQPGLVTNNPWVVDGWGLRGGETVRWSVADNSGRRIYVSPGFLFPARDAWVVIDPAAGRFAYGSGVNPPLPAVRSVLTPAVASGRATRPPASFARALTPGPAMMGIGNYYETPDT